MRLGPWDNFWLFPIHQDGREPPQQTVTSHSPSHRPPVLQEVQHHLSSPSQTHVRQILRHPRMIKSLSRSTQSNILEGPTGFHSWTSPSSHSSRRSGSSDRIVSCETKEAQRSERVWIVGRSSEGTDPGALDIGNYQ